MLCCPFCQFENSDSQLFCGQCGRYLQRWCAIRIPRGEASPPARSNDDSAYLDAAQRYRYLDSLDHLASGLVSLDRVLDCDVQATSPLESLQEAWFDSAPAPPAASVGPTVPPEAIAYLALQVDAFPAVPELHNAWESDQWAVLLIEDRFHWQSLLEAWPTQDASPGQQMQWLFEMTLLWQALDPWQTQTTLLNPQSLKVDANYGLCLTHLDPVPVPESLPLQRLGQFWQRSLPLTPHTAPILVQLIEAVADGTLTQVTDVQTQLAIATDALRPANCSHETFNPTGALAANPVSDAPDYSEDDVMLAFPIDWDADSDTDDPTDPDLKDLADLMSSPLDSSEDEGNPPNELPTTILPMKLAQVDDIGQSHVGRQRNHNEDWFLTQTQLTRASDPKHATLSAKGLYILCDGMGGHAAGEVASQMAVETLRNYFAERWTDTLPDQAALIAAVIQANQAIFDVNQAKASSGIGRMGTTLVMVLLQDLTMTVTHVGDSRLYSYCKRLGLQQLTVDHEVGQREIYRGIEPAIAYARPDAYQLTQALGPRDQSHLSPIVSYHDISEDTLLILCSDGLSDNNLLESYTDTHIAPLLSARTSLETGVSQLIDLANEKNGHDNITAVVVRVKLKPDMGFLG
ncbi:MAG: serine/threonine phosphatase [Leptolyngbya sp. LCM1.Bin17]|nr:MAG: serine/threonine phosphatase [Leptolyngbya sp. LCM1.Bin17]